MDALLPSEIARLVLGYLQEQKCEEAAKIFMETSPLLQECRMVAQRGGRYSTKVGGLSLMDVLDKYCATNAMVQEKLSKVSDCEQLKHCNDLLEQLRYLLEGSRGHRFVVNISVPSQNSPSGSFGSPVVSGSMRKRHHSSSDRGKRVAKSLTNFLDKPTQNPIIENYDTVEATPLESLPGHQISTNQIDSENDMHFLSNKCLIKSDVNSSIEHKIHVPMVVDTNLDPNLIALNSSIISLNHKSQLTETVQNDDSEQAKNKCTAGTSTEELLNYCSTEVQTGPCDILESESDVNDEPIENLSILTKKLLQRTELHERIAENINKAILPVETSFREENVYENATEANMSLLTDYDNAIKSVVQATETDPIFEGFLHEIFKIGETDTSPDEDSDARQNRGLINPTYTQNDEPIQINNSNELIDVIEPKINDQEPNGPEVPLKQRLRSSSRSQNTNVDDEEKESNSVLENQNAEAIMNIVNVIASKRNSLVNNESENKVPTEIVTENKITIEAPNNVKPEIEKSNECNKAVNNIKSPPKKSSGRKTKSSKSKSTLENADNSAVVQMISEQEIMTMPTLILCSEKDVESLLQPDIKRTKPLKENFIPIAPKPNEITSTLTEPQPTIYLRTVNVPRHLLTPAQIEASTKPNPLLLQQALQVQQPFPRPVAPTTIDVTPVTESITLYGGGNESAAVKVAPIASMPVINLDDSTIDLGNGLSPLFKAEEAKVAEKSTVVEISMEVDKISNQAEKSTCVSVVDSVITRHTPRTLLKSRSKNNRLSLSTPRRRNSHVRALDFNTPLKMDRCTRKLPQSCGKTQSVCRTELFRSPPFVTEKGVEPTYMRVPIATRSPAPKLQGNWSKLTGIGLILGDASTSESSPEKSQPEIVPTFAKKSWDSDLRKIVGSTITENVTKPMPRNSKKTKRKSALTKVTTAGKALQSKKQVPDCKPEIALQLSKCSNNNPTKISPEMSACSVSRFQNTLDLETPRKTEVMFYVPPTPRLLNTPGDSLIKYERSKSNHEFIIKDCVDTPEFPITPCIVLTPKIIEEDNEKKSSPYYEPSDDQTQPVKQKELVNSERTVVEETMTMRTTTTATAVAAMTTTTTTTTIEKNVVEVKENMTIEVTREVVKENKTTEEEKEEEPTSEETSKEIIEEESVGDTNVSDSDSDNETSDSSSSSSSNSSTSSSSSSSSCSSHTPSPMKSILVDGSTRIDSVSVESRIDSPDRLLQNFTKISQEEFDKIENEISPMKTVKDTSTQETPAKDEDNAIPEGKISETPSASETERALRRDSLAGLTSKMSAIVTSPRNDQPIVKTNEDTCAVSSSERPLAKPRILNVQKIVAGDRMAFQVSKMLQLEKQKNSGPTIQQQQHQQLMANNAKLSMQLEEKRRRVMAKFKEAANHPKKTANETRQRKARKGAEAEKLVTSSTDSFRSKGKQIQSTEEKVFTKSEPSRETLEQLCNDKLEDGKTDEDSKEGKRIKVRTSLRKKATRDEQSVNTEYDAELEADSHKIHKEVLQTVTKEETPVKDENSKGALKTKVDQIKRDLFSDEEANDQRTTRSQVVRRTVDTLKIDESQDPYALFDAGKEKMPGVLECLQLIPANKSEQDLHELGGKNTSSDGLSNNQTNALDVSYTYDESVPIKKRKRKYSNSELASEYTFRYPDEVHVLSVTPYKEMFKLAPKIKKKIQSPKKSPIKVKKTKPCDKNIEQILNSSSLVNSLSIKSERLHSDNKKRKSCKRKTSPMKEISQNEKKTKPDPLALFNKIKIDEFLKSVHIPE